MYRTLEYLSGISDDDVRRLRAVGIHHTNQFLHRASLDIDRRRLFKKTGISTERLIEFAHQCTLLEVSGMERWVPLVRRLGINSMHDLRAQDAGELHRKLIEAIGLAGAPSLTDVQYWISQATALDIVEQPEPAPPLAHREAGLGEEAALERAQARAGLARERSDRGHATGRRAGRRARAAPSGGSRWRAKPPAPQKATFGSIAPNRSANGPSRVARDRAISDPARNRTCDANSRVVARRTSTSCRTPACRWPPEAESDSLAWREHPDRKLASRQRARRRVPARGARIYSSTFSFVLFVKVSPTEVARCRPPERISL